MILGIEGSVAGSLATNSTAYSTVLVTQNATDLILGTNQTMNLKIASGGAATFSSTLAVTGAATFNAGGTSVVMNSSSTYNAIRFNQSAGAQGFIGSDYGQSLCSTSANGDMVLRADVTGTILFSASTAQMGKLTTGTFALSDGQTIQWASSSNRVFFNGGAFRVDVNGSQYLGISTAGLVTMPGTLSVTGVVTVAQDIQYSSNSGYGILSANSTRVLAVRNTGLNVTGSLAVSAPAGDQMTWTSSTLSAYLYNDGSAMALSSAASAGGEGIIFTPSSHLLTLRTNGSNAVIISSAQAVRFLAYGAGAATFDASGNITSTSDMRHKMLQGTFGVGLSELRTIDPILYKWNEASGNEMEHTYAGFSAQNLKAASEYFCGVRTDGILSMQDRAILAACVNAIKELDARASTITALTARVAALEAQ
jgi:hypothetical protein